MCLILQEEPGKQINRVDLTLNGGATTTVRKIEILIEIAINKKHHLSKTVCFFHL